MLRNTVIKGTQNYTPSNEDVAAFCIVADQYDLNPFTREIHAFVNKAGGVTPIVGIDGWVKLVNRNATFDGCTLDMDDDESGKLVSCTCTMRVKGRQHPVIVTEYLSECVRPTDPWRTMPRRMLRHKAYMQAARLAFGLSGIYDEDEANDIVSRDVEVVDSKPGTKAKSIVAAIRNAREQFPTTAEPQRVEAPAQPDQQQEHAAEPAPADSAPEAIASPAVRDTDLPSVSEIRKLTAGECLAAAYGMANDVTPGDDCTLVSVEGSDGAIARMRCTSAGDGVKVGEFVVFEGIACHQSRNAKLYTAESVRLAAQS